METDCRSAWASRPSCPPTGALYTVNLIFHWIMALWSIQCGFAETTSNKSMDGELRITGMPPTGGDSSIEPLLVSSCTKVSGRVMDSLHFSDNDLKPLQRSDGRARMDGKTGKVVQSAQLHHLCRFLLELSEGQPITSSEHPFSERSWSDAPWNPQARGRALNFYGHFFHEGMNEWRTMDDRTAAISAENQRMNLHTERTGALVTPNGGDMPTQTGNMTLNPRSRSRNALTTWRRRTAQVNLTSFPAEADQLAIDQLNAGSAELVSAYQAQWTAVLNGMRYVPVPGSEPTTVQRERQDLADILLHTMRAVIWNNSMGELHSRSTLQLHHDLSHNVKILAAAVKVADNQLKQLDARIATLEARPPQAAPGCTPDMTDTTKQLNGRIDHVVNLIGDIGVFNGPDTISSTVAAIKTNITKLQTKPDAATKSYKMPHFDISKFDDHNKTDALAWWQHFLTEASCRTVPDDYMMKALYLQLIGGAQAWMNHLAATHTCTIAELHTHITWKEFEQLWFTRFMVRN
ncbi:hypothetical protein CBR_g51382, partial [Chara braunii]